VILATIHGRESAASIAHIAPKLGTGTFMSPAS
jgi:hypothetical protein